MSKTIKFQNLPYTNPGFKSFALMIWYMDRIKIILLTFETSLTYIQYFVV